MKTLHFARGLDFPDDATTQTFAMLARRGAGKTYAAGVLVEGLLDQSAQVMVIDPVGIWWGLRLKSDGKTPAHDVVIFGGLHGDLPLEPGAGALIANVLVDSGRSAVVDVSMMRKGERKRFATDFAEQLFHRKKENRTPMHLVLEESQVFVPQRVSSDEARMLGAFEDLVKLGRNFGIGVTLISQRPQAVNKDVLNQTECLVVLQTNGAQERKALKEWIVEQGLDVGDIVSTLPGLKRGEAWVWSPSWLGITKRVHINQKRTFDTSSTPKLGDGRPATTSLVPLDLEQLRVSMATLLEAVEKNDAEALRRRIRQLEAELAAKPQVLQEVRVPVIDPATLQNLQASLAEVGLELARWAPHGTQRIPGGEGVSFSTKPMTSAPTASGGGGPAPAPRPPTSSADLAGLKLGARVMLSELVACGVPLTRRQLGTRAVIASPSGTFSEYVSSLRRGGFIEESAGGDLQATESARKIVGAAPPRTRRELATLWSQKFKAGARKMLEAVLEADGLDNVELAKASGIRQPSGTFSEYVSSLRRSGVVEKRGTRWFPGTALSLGGR